ncbi:putative phage tail protein [Bacillus sp. AK031]
MIKTLPLFMRKSQYINDVFDAEGKQIAALNTDLDDIRLQMDVDTATWGLDIFEKGLDIPVNHQKSFQERRGVIKSKMRGSGKVDAVLLKVVADSYTNGDVVVDFDGAIFITFTSQIGRPPNLEALKEAIENTKPAHLPVTYEFRFITMGEVSAMTIGEVNALLLENMGGGVN